MSDILKTTVVFDASEASRNAQKYGKTLEELGYTSERSARKQIDAWKEQSDELKTAIKANNKEIAEFDKQLKELNKKPQTNEVRIKLLMDQKQATVENTFELEKERGAIDDNAKAVKRLIAEGASLLSQKKDLKRQMENLVLAGKGESKQYKELTKQMERVGTAYQSVKKDEQNLSTGGTQMAGIMNGIQGLSGALSVYMGVSGMFNSNQKELEKIQKNIQATMAISMGMYQVANTLHETSNFRMVTARNVTELWRLAQTKLTASLWGSTVAAKALMGTITLGLSVVIGFAVAAISKWVDKQEEAKKKSEELRKEQTKFIDDVAKSAAPQIVALKKLQSAYTSLGDNIKAKEKFIKDNKKAIDDCGLSIKNHADAEKAFVTDTPKYVEALMARARAAAYGKLAEGRMGEAVGITQQIAQERTAVKNNKDKAPELKYKEEDRRYKKVTRYTGTVNYIGEEYDEQATEKAFEERIKGLESKREKLEKASEMWINAQVNSEKAANTLLVDPNKSDKPDKPDKEIKDYANEAAKGLLDLNKLKTDLMADGRAKELKQIEDAKNEKLYALDKELKETEDLLAKGRLTKDQKADLTKKQVALSGSKEAEIKIADKKAKEVNKKYDDEEAETWKTLTSVFLSEEQKRAAAVSERYEKVRKLAKERLADDPEKLEKWIVQIDASEAQENLESLKNSYQTYADRRKQIETKFDNDIADLTKKNAGGKLDGNIKEAERLKTEALSSLDAEIAGREEMFNGWVSQVGSLGINQLQKLLTSAKADVEAAITNGDAGEDTTASLRAKVDALNKQIEKLKSKGKNAVNAKNWKDTLQIIKDTKSVVEDIIDSFDGLSEEGKLALEAAKNVADGAIMMIGGITQVANLASESISTVEKASIILTIISAAVKLIMAIVNLVKGLDTAEKEAEIKRMQKEIDGMTKAYDALWVAIDKAYSADASKLIDQSNKLLAKQKELTKIQIAEEEAKKDPDKERIADFNKKLEELDETIAENREKAIDAIFGSDVKSAIDDFASAYMEAWGAGEDRAASQKEVVKRMIKGIIQEMLKSDIANQVQAMREKIKGYMSDDKLSDSELEDIDRMGEQIGAILESRGKQYEKILKGDANNDKSLAGQIRGSVATEESVAELGGIFRGQYDKLSSIDAKMADGFKSISEIARSNTAIERNTREIAANTAQVINELVTGFSAVKDELSVIKTNTSKDNGGYGA